MSEIFGFIVTDRFLFFFYLFIQMDFLIHIDTISMKLSFLYFKGLQDKISNLW